MLAISSRCVSADVLRFAFRLGGEKENNLHVFAFTGFLYAFSYIRVYLPADGRTGEASADGLDRTYGV